MFWAKAQSRTAISLMIDIFLGYGKQISLTYLEISNFWVPILYTNIHLSKLSLRIYNF